MEKMRRLTIVWTFLIVSLFVILTVFGFIYKNKTKVYKELEEKLVSAEKRYVDANFLYPDMNEELKTLASTLISEGYLDTLEVNGEICDGYVKIFHETTVFEYKAYITCNKYQTKGYEN